MLSGLSDYFSVALQRLWKWVVSQGFDPYLQRQVFPEDQDNIERQRQRHLSGRQEAAFMDLLHDLGERAGQV
jgi:hypothetical protein